MKKKPHQKQSVLKKVFSDFRKRTYTGNSNDRHYEVIEEGDGYTVRIHAERGADETYFFSSKKELENFIRSKQLKKF